MNEDVCTAIEVQMDVKEDEALLKDEQCYAYGAIVGEENVVKADEPIVDDTEAKDFTEDPPEAPEPGPATNQEDSTQAAANGQVSNRGEKDKYDYDEIDYDNLIQSQFKKQEELKAEKNVLEGLKKQKRRRKKEQVEMQS